MGQGKVILLVSSIFIISIVTGSFYYTKDYKAEAQSTMELHRMLIDANKERYLEMKGDNKVLINKIEQLTEAMKNSTDRSGELIRMLIEKRSGPIG